VKYEGQEKRKSFEKREKEEGGGQASRGVKRVFN